MKEFNDALLDIAWKNLDRQYNRFKDIDTKAIGIITISGILMAFIAKSGDGEQISISAFFFMLTSLLFFITILLSICAIRTRQIDIASTNKLIEELKDASEERQIPSIIGSIAASEHNVCKVSNAKAKNLRFAIYAFGISIISMICYSLSTIF